MAFFDTDAAGHWQARARALRTQLDQDAVARDRSGTRPDAALLQLRASGLPAATLPVTAGGGDAPLSEALLVVRELARTDGSVAQLYGEHLVPLLRLTGLAAAAPGTAGRSGSDQVAGSGEGANDPVSRVRALIADSARQQWIWAEASGASPTARGRLSARRGDSAAPLAGSSVRDDAAARHGSATAAPLAGG